MLLLAAYALLFGCAPPPYDADVASTEPSISITWPLPETSAEGCVIVTVDIQNFTVVNPGDANGELQDGEGHYHVVTPGGYDACSAPYCVSDFTTLTADQSGELRVLLVDNNHQTVQDAGGQPYESSILFNFVANPICGLTDDAGATGGDDSGT